MPQVLTIPLDKKKKDDIIDLLDTSYKPLLVFLNSPSSDNSGLEKDPDLLDKIFLARSISIKIVERLIVGRKPRSSLDIYPDWLTDTGFLSLLRNFLKTAETSDTKADYYLWDVEGTQRVPVSRSQWTDWLKQAIHAMKIRSQQMKEEQSSRWGKTGGVLPYRPIDNLDGPNILARGTLYSRFPRKAAGELGKEDDDKRLFTVGRSGDDFEKPIKKGQETLQFLESPLLSVEGNKKRNPLDQLFHFELSPEFSVLPPKPQRLQHLRDNEQQKKLLQAKTEQITEQIPEGIDSERNVVGAYYNVKYPMAYDNLKATHFPSSTSWTRDSTFSSAAKEGARSSSPGRTDEDKRKEKGGGETVCEGEWTQVKKRKDKHLRGSVTGGVYTRSQAGEGREVRQPNRFHVLQTEEGRDEMEVEPDQGRKNPVEETGEFFTFSSVSRPNPGGTFFFQGGSRSPSDKVARMELRMWRKMVTSVNDKELSHLVQNLREEHAEMNRMMQEGEDAFQSRCAELQISLSSQKGKVMKKNFDEQAWKLQLKMQMIRTRLAYCTNEGEERRERKDRKKDRKKESDKGNETDLSSMEEEEEGLEGEKKILEGKEVIEEDPEGKKVEVVRTENTEQEMEVTSQDNIVSVQEQESSEPSGVPLNQELYAKQLRLDLYPKPVNLDILSQACLEAELPISSETTPPL
ncbi:UNVERIFIED_CONTAM: hypothetical protein K2H54_065796 [Gekko kuhli]